MNIKRILISFALSLGLMLALGTWLASASPVTLAGLPAAVSANGSVASAGGLWITRVTPTGDASHPFDRMEIQFSAAVQTGTFTLADVAFTGPGGTITPTALNQLAADRYELASSGTGLNIYSLVIGPDIRDLSNQAMDQNHNGIPGEPGDAYRGALFSNGVTITDTQTTYEGQNLIIYGNAAVVDGSHRFASVEVLGGATLFHSATTTSAEYQLNLAITDTLWITAGAAIDVSARGYPCGYTVGLTTTSGATINAGGSYGGLGSAASGSSTNWVYGDYRDPNELGSGGGCPGGSGGGLARITAGAAIVEGNITANGGDGWWINYVDVPGGSGGGIWLNVGSLSGHGVIAANGGGGRNYGGQSGGGGRVAVYYDTLNGFDLLANVQAHAGNNGGGFPGAVGSVYLKQNSGEGQLRLDNHGMPTGVWTPLGVPADTAFVVDDLVISGTNVIAAPEHELPIYADNVSILAGTLTHQSTSSREYSLRMTITGTLLVSTTANIDVSARGYPCGWTVGLTTTGAATGNAGGSYGGLGFAVSGSTNPVYGDYRNPNELGSGGGCPGGAGGGLVRITAGAVDLEGNITANGGNGWWIPSGGGMLDVPGGSGGGIWLNVGSFSGQGVIVAKGGDGWGYGGAGGGGGRVAVYYKARNDYDLLTNVQAHGGSNGGNLSGTEGTVYLHGTDMFAEQTAFPPQGGVILDSKTDALAFSVLQRYLIRYYYGSPDANPPAVPLSVHDTLTPNMLFDAETHTPDMNFQQTGQNLTWQTQQSMPVDHVAEILLSTAGNPPPGQTLVNQVAIDAGSRHFDLQATTTAPIFPPLITSIGNGEYCYRNAVVNVNGISQSSAQVRVFENDSPVITTTADARGVFTSTYLSLNADAPITVTAITCNPLDPAQCSAESAPVHLVPVNSFWDPQRSYWEGTPTTGPMAGHHLTYNFRDSSGSFSTQNWQIPGVYGFWNTHLHLYVCDAPKNVTVTADGANYPPTSISGNWYWFNITFAHQVTFHIPDHDDPGNVLIDPDGYVFDVTRGLSRTTDLSGTVSVTNTIAGVTVTCMVSMPQWGGWVPWPAQLYNNQLNPQVTGPDGYFSFFTPPGSYYLQVDGVDSFQSWRSPVVQVITQIVHVNVPLTPWPVGNVSQVTLTPNGPSPAVITVPVGSAVEWVAELNDLMSPTDLASLTDNPILRLLSARDPLTDKLGFDGGMLAPGRVYRRQFTKPGTYAYSDGAGHTAQVVVINYRIYLPLVMKNH